MKIIHLLSHSISLREDHILDGWPSRTAKNIKKNSNDRYLEQECWFAVYNIKNVIEWERGGIKYKMFPAWTLNKLLESFCGVIFSNKLIDVLKIEANKQEVVFHIQGERSFLLWQIIRVVKKSPIFLQFHGYYVPWLLILVEKLFFTPIEKHFFKYINNFFVLAGSQRKYLIEKCKISPKKIYDSALGVDYNTFIPIDKNWARKELSLPIEKNIILYVGLFNEVKGVDKIINAHLKIKKSLNTFLVLIGGTKGNKYYDYCVKNADLVIGPIDHDLLPKYFSAADVYCMICNKRKAKYAGLGIASVEALACNVPILNSDLNDAPEQIRDRIGFIVNSADDLKEKLIYVLNNKDRYNNLREITKPFFSWEKIIPNIINLYNKSNERLTK